MLDKLIKHKKQRDILDKNIMEKESELNNIKDYIYRLKNEIDILNNKIISISRRLLIVTAFMRLLSFMFIIFGVIVIGGICNINFFFMFLFSMLLITVSIFVNNYFSKLLNRKYNINQIKESINDKKILLNEYSNKINILVNELGVIKYNYCKNEEMILFIENIIRGFSCDDIKCNTYCKLKTKTKKG